MSDKCPECGSTEFRRDSKRAEVLCAKCGLVLDESQITSEAEYRVFEQDQWAKKARVGAATSFIKPNKGLITHIDMYNRDVHGTQINSKKIAQLQRLRKWHQRSNVSNAVERNLVVALLELERMASFLGLAKNVRESAALIYRKAVDMGLIRGRSIEAVATAVLYTVCRQYGVPRTLTEIAKISSVTKKDIGKTYRFLCRELGMKVPLINPTHYVPRFGSALNLSGQAQQKAIDLIKQAMDKGLTSGHGPMGVAAAAIYISSVLLGEGLTQKEVADVAGVTEVTIRNRYRELKTKLGIDIKD